MKVKVDELRKSLEELDFSEEDINSIIEKAQKEDGVEDTEKEKDPETDETAEEIEKKKEEGIEKSLDIDLFKSIQEVTALQIGKITDRLTASLSEAIEKSITPISEEIENMKASLQKISEQPISRRGVSNQSVLEKGIKEDIDGDNKRILSVSQNKEEVIKAMENVIEKSTDSLKKDQFSKALLHYNMGGSTPSQDIAQELYLKENIRLVR